MVDDIFKYLLHGKCGAMTDEQIKYFLINGKFGIAELESETLPMTFKAKRTENLKNYRIYGNTETKTRSYNGTAPLSFPIEDGAVSNYRVYGQMSRNLFDEELAQGYYSDTAGSSNDLISSSLRVAGTTFIPVSTGNTMTLTYESAIGITKYLVYYYNNNKELINAVGWNINGSTITIPDNISFIRVVWGAKEDWSSGHNYVTLLVANISNIMLNFGSTALPYEPYGESVGELVTDSQSEYYGKYAIPITNNSETANIYLDEPLTKSGNNADYIDYATQKRHNADGTSADVTMPELPAQSSTNSLSVGTTVQPSSVSVDVGEVVSCGDKITDSQNANYGKYKIPVTLTANSTETTDIYLDTPLAKSGNNADYIDFKTQKRYNSDGTEITVTLPEIAVTTGTNTLTVGTEIQPSKVYLQGHISRGDNNAE